MFVSRIIYVRSDLHFVIVLSSYVSALAQEEYVSLRLYKSLPKRNCKNHYTGCSRNHGAQGNQPLLTQYKIVFDMGFE